MMRLAAGGSGTAAPRQDRDVMTEQDIGISGTQCDIYRHARKNRSTWILVHGLTINGGKDPRLIRFAYALARSGVRCVVPTLPGLSTCRLEKGDPEKLAAIIRAESKGNRETVGLVGFSYGGSYGLLAAAQKETAPHLRHVICFGAYHDLSPLLDFYAEQQTRTPQNDAQWDEMIYCRLAALYGSRDRSPLPPGMPEEMGSLLERYCGEAKLDEKKEFHNRYLRDFGLNGEELRMADAETAAALSPAGVLEHILCPVTLIHDRNDTLVPPEHSQQIHSHLQRLPNPKRHRLVITTLLSHVPPGKMFRPRDVIALANSLAILVN